MGNYKSRNFKVKKYPNIKTELGTMDKEQMRSLFLLFRGDAKCIVENKNAAIIRLNKSIYNVAEKTLNKELFKDRFICTIDKPDKFIDKGNGYVSIEFTLYFKDKPKNEMFVTELEEFVEQIYEVINQNQDIKFYTNENRQRHKSIKQEVVREKKKRGRKKKLQ